MTTIGNLPGTLAYFSPPDSPVTHFLNRPPRLVWLPKNNQTQKRSGNETRKYGTLRINPFSMSTYIFADTEKGIHQRPKSTILNLKNQFSNLTFKSSGGPLNRPHHNLQHQHYQSRKKNPSESSGKGNTKKHETESLVGQVLLPSSLAPLPKRGLGSLKNAERCLYGHQGDLRAKLRKGLWGPLEEEGQPSSNCRLALSLLYRFFLDSSRDRRGFVDVVTVRSQR